jgi:hypothetical protein
VVYFWCATFCGAATGQRNHIDKEFVHESVVPRNTSSRLSHIILTCPLLPLRQTVPDIKPEDRKKRTHRTHAPRERCVVTRGYEYVHERAQLKKTVVSRGISNFFVGCDKGGNPRRFRRLYSNRITSVVISWTRLRQNRQFPNPRG